MNKKIVIIGAGPSGIAAATKLKSNGFQNITLLEAEQRIGGRINTIQFGENVLDMGAQWWVQTCFFFINEMKLKKQRYLIRRCHGEKGNVVYDMAKDKNLLATSIPTFEKFNFIRSNGEQISQDTDGKLSTIYFELLDGYEEEKSNYNGSFGNFFAEK